MKKQRVDNWVTIYTHFEKGGSCTRLRRDCIGAAIGFSLFCSRIINLPEKPISNNRRNRFISRSLLKRDSVFGVVFLCIFNWNAGNHTQPTVPLFLFSCVFFLTSHPSSLGTCCLFGFFSVFLLFSFVRFFVFLKHLSGSGPTNIINKEKKNSRRM